MTTSLSTASKSRVISTLRTTTAPPPRSSFKIMTTRQTRPQSLKREHLPLLFFLPLFLVIFLLVLFFPPPSFPRHIPLPPLLNPLPFSLPYSSFLSFFLLYSSISFSLPHPSFSSSSSSYSLHVTTFRFCSSGPVTYSTVEDVVIFSFQQRGRGGDAVGGEERVSVTVTPQLVCGGAVPHNTTLTIPHYSFQAPYVCNWRITVSN